MTLPVPDGESFTELIDATIGRVDLVGKAANGTAFLIAKAAADRGHLTHALVAPEQVRELLAKAEQTHSPDTDEVTSTVPETDTVAKEDGDAPVSVDEIIPDAPAGGTAATVPGSPDWEQLDGDTARAAVSTLFRLKQVIGWLADREAQEAVTGDGSDGYAALDLDDMATQIDCILGRLAAFSVGEHLEAGLEDGELEAVGKAAADAVAPLGVLEAFAPVAKAGRVLSSSNEAAIRAAVESLQGVLASLPQAPAADDTVTKTEETPVPAPAPEAPAAEPVDLLTKALAALPRIGAEEVATALLAGGRTQEVVKAKGDPAMAVFDANGKLVGVIDPADLQPIAETAPPADGDAQGADEEPAADDAAPAGDAAPAADAAPADDSRVVPGTDTVQAPPQAPEDDQTPAVAKAADAPVEEDRVAQLAKQVQSLAAANEVLQDTVRKMGLLPDDRKSPRLNGANGVAGVVTRDSGDPEDEVAALRKAAAEATDPKERLALSQQAFFASVGARFAG